MSTLEDLVASLAPEAREALLAQLDGHETDHAADAVVVRDKTRQTIARRASGRVPLSYAQRGLWFLSQLRPADTSYHICYSIEWAEELDLAALRTALSDLTDRHEVLRTVIPAPDGEPRQVILPSLRVPIAEVSLADDDIAGEDERTRSLATQPFDLASGPLLRAMAIRRGRHRTLVLAVHHIVFDARSVEIFLDELVRLYDARVSGRPPGLADLPVQFADFAAWQHDWFAGHALDADLAYWRAKLDGLQVLALPADRQRSDVTRSAGAAREFEVGDQLRASLAAVGRKHDATLFMVLIAGFVALLHRYTGRDDIAVGTSVTTRDLPETECLIGYFLNTLVLRTKLTGEATFADLLDLVQGTVLEAFEHKDMPFELLVEDLAPERRPGALPLVPVLFEFSGSGQSPTGDDRASQRIVARGVDSEGARADLTLVFQDAPDGLHGVIEYDLALFDADTIDRMCGRLLHLLESAAARPDTSVKRLSIMTDEDALLAITPVPERAAEYVDPRDDVEAAVASLFAELTGVEKVGAYDDFFTIGGDSQLVSRLHASLVSDFGIDLPAGELFEIPTVEGVAGKIVQQIMQWLGEEET